MSNYFAQNTIRVMRLRTNDSLSLAFRTNGKPLHQYVDASNPASPQVRPDWGDAANQPVIYPRITSLQGNAVTINWFKWYYNTSNTPLAFTGAQEAGFTKTADGVFGAMENGADKGALRIFSNLASASNDGSDSLRFECEVSVGGVEYALSGSVTIDIQSGGANAYYMYISSANGETLSTTVPTTTLTAKILMGGVEQNVGFSLEWWKDTDKLAETGNTLVVTRDDVDGFQTFICKAVVGGSVVAGAGYTIQDAEDEYSVALSYVSANHDIAPNQSVTVRAALFNMSSKSEVTNAQAYDWRLYVYDGAYNLIRQQNSTDARPTITLTTADTDNGGQMNDLNLVAEVTADI